MPVRGVSMSACLVALLFLAACAEPPHKELDRAQGAIDAARAAGAEQYATPEFEAATAALDNAHAAVAARDFRLALSYALESHEHAQNAARDTADTKARVRADVERAIGSLETVLAGARERLTAAQAARVSRAALETPGRELAALEEALQEARAAVETGEYLKANAALDGLQHRVDAVVASIETAVSEQSARRRR